MSLKIFVSYNTADRENVKTLIDDLEALDHATWFDQEVTGGQVWWEMILSQIRECDLFMAALTPNLLASPWCGLEYTYASALNKRILPVLLIDTDLQQLPTELIRIQFVDYREADKRAFAALRKAIDRLPPALPLPHPLPTPPERFVSAIGRLRERISAAALTFEEQAAILFDLKGRLDVPEDAAAAHELLRIFQRRDDLLARIYREVESLLGAKPAPPRVNAPQSTKMQHSYKQFKLIRTFVGHTAGVRGCDFNPDASVIVSGSADNTLKLWNAQTGRETHVLTGHRDKVFDCAFSPDGKLVASASWDETVRLWDAKTGKEIRKLIHSDAVYGCAFNSDSRYVIAARGNRQIIQWSIDGNLIHTLRGHSDLVRCCAFSPDGKQIISGADDSNLILWNAKSGEKLRVLSGHTAVGFFSHYGVFGCSFSPDGTMIVSCGSDKTIRIWETASGKAIRTITGHEHWVWDCAFSPDGRVILSASADHTLRLWDASTGKQIHQLNGHTDNVYACKFSRDGRYIVSASKDKTLKLWGIS